MNRFSNIDQSTVHFIPLSLEYVSCLTMSKTYNVLIPLEGGQWAIILSTDTFGGWSMGYNPKYWYLWRVVNEL